MSRKMFVSVGACLITYLYTLRPFFISFWPFLPYHFGRQTVKCQKSLTISAKKQNFATTPAQRSEGVGENLNRIYIYKFLPSIERRVEHSK